jgi:long-chain fatty acid transport protein
MTYKKMAALLAISGIAAPAFATNGMNQAGYGPISEGMGGTSMAYDNGVAGAINNPATLGFIAPGTSRLDVGFGDLRPAATVNGQGSTATDFYMPGLGYVRKDGNLAWGIAVMAQGGMGTDYSNGNFWGTLAPFNPTANAALNTLVTQGQSMRNMSQLGVGRVMFPLAFNVNQDLTIGGSVDYVWAGLDIKWLIDGMHFRDMVPALGGQNIFAQGSGSMINTMLSIPGFAGLGYGYFDFEKSGQFYQKATGTGWAGNIGFTYKVSPALTVGGVYHAKTSLSDLKTSESGASIQLAALILPTPGAFTQTVTGKATVKNFQWPETWGIGLSYEVNPQWTVNADYKRINWAGVMKNFNLSFEADGSATNGAFAGKALDIVYFQNWNNQNVLQVGAAYKYNDALTIRFGANIGDNPIPDKYVSALFPAIMKDHYSAGVGYAFSKVSAIDAAFVYAPKVRVTNNWAAVGGSNQNISLGTDISYQVMYSHRF